jgi:thiol-disulfide isomerase/thioredoxin
MKHVLYVLIAAFIFSFPLSGQVSFTTVDSREEMEAVYIKAYNQKTNIFVDVYATWCGPCKWMDANVFALEEAGNYMNREFINVKIDGDSEFGYAFARENGLEAYPSFFLFNDERKLMNKIVGAKPWEEFHPALEGTLENYPVLVLLQNKYDSGLLDQSEYARFLHVLDKMGKNDLASGVAEQYVANFFEGGLTDETMLSDYDIEVLALHTAPAGSGWRILASDPARLQRILGEEFSSFLDTYYNHMLMQAVDYEDETLLNTLHEDLSALTEGSEIDAVELQTRASVLYFTYTGQFDNLVSYIDSSYEHKFNGNHEWLFSAASDAVFVDPNNMRLVEKGLEWFEECIRVHPEMNYYYHLGYCQYLVEDIPLAIASFKKALELADTDENRAEIRGIIEQLEAEAE